VLVQQDRQWQPTARLQQAARFSVTGRVTATAQATTLTIRCVAALLLCAPRFVRLRSAAQELAGNYGFDPLYLSAKDEDALKW
jgi:diacylglycerol kinase